MINSLRGRILSVLLVVLAALLPFLYLGISRIVQDGYAEGFVNSVRTYSGLVADELEASDGASFDARAEALLDGAVLSGQVVFAEVTDGTRTLRSRIARDSGPCRAATISASATTAIRPITSPTASSRAIARCAAHGVRRKTDPRAHQVRPKRHVLLAIAAFLAASIVVAIWLSALLARPWSRCRRPRSASPRGRSTRRSSHGARCARYGS